MKKYKLVQFSDGTYGVKHWLFNVFLDLEFPDEFTWGVGSIHFKDCRGTYQKAKEALNLKKAKKSITWKVVKEQP